MVVGLLSAGVRILALSLMRLSHKPSTSSGQMKRSSIQGLMDTYGQAAMMLSSKTSMYVVYFLADELTDIFSLLFLTPYLLDLQSLYAMCDMRFLTLPRMVKKVLRVLGSPSS